MINEYKPFSVVAEQSVVGAILLDNDSAPDILEAVSSDDFHSEQNRLIFRAIELLLDDNQPCDVITVVSYLETTGRLEETGGLPYLAEIAENTPSAANAVAYARVVRNKRRERDILKLSTEMAEVIFSDDLDSEDKVNQALSLASGIDSTENKLKTYADFTAEAVEMLQKRADSKECLSGVSTGFKDLDARLDGLQKTDLLILAARPAQGKTTLAMNIAKAVASNKTAMVFSLEMSGPQLINRLWASYGVPLSNIKKADLSDSEVSNSLFRAVSESKDLKFVIDDRPAATPQQIRARCLKEKRLNGDIGVVVIDYLQLMTVGKSVSRTEDTTKISQALKALAKELNCPVIALSQLNRGVEQRSNKRPHLSDLRGSGAIEQDADIIMFVYRDDYYAEQEGRQSEAPNTAEIITAKYRDGEVGTDLLKTDFAHSRFLDFTGDDGFDYYDN